LHARTDSGRLVDRPFQLLQFLLVEAFGGVEDLQANIEGSPFLCGKYTRFIAHYIQNVIEPQGTIGEGHIYRSRQPLIDLLEEVFECLDLGVGCFDVGRNEEQILEEVDGGLEGVGLELFLGVDGVVVREGDVIGLHIHALIALLLFEGAVLPDVVVDGQLGDGVAPVLDAQVEVLGDEVHVAEVAAHEVEQLLVVLFDLPVAVLRLVDYHLRQAVHVEVVQVSEAVAQVARVDHVVHQQSVLEVLVKH
jgi:hypothetical protein